MTYLRRLIDHQLNQFLPELPAIALEGARGVGKTETASRRAATIFHVDRREQAELLRASLGGLGALDGPVLIDEWQHTPEVFDAIRRLVDSGATPGSFLLTGSRPPIDHPVHSGAGRIDFLRMRPLSVAERFPQHQSVFLSDLMAGNQEIEGRSPLTLRDYVEEITSSGFPGIRPLSGVARAKRLDGYITRIVEREFVELGVSIRRPDTLRLWLRAYASATGSSASYEKILRAATPGVADKPARPTTSTYVDALNALWLIDPLEHWYPPGSAIGALTQTPKHYLADPALAARLLSVTTDQLISGDTGAPLGPQVGSLLGRLFESLVVMSLKSYAATLGWEISHFRLHGGRREVDVILSGEGGRIIGLEIKLAPQVGPDDTEHLLWLKQKLGDQVADVAVITTGEHAYRRADDGVAVIPLACLGVDRNIPLGLA
ncbi:AAA+ ATPase domain-containing protein [Pontimonas salivibrio]|uniref:AAA+ ATPase domain-containing protein n=1 Tax=Pontimonas salivibrio TaxID=1159327 RepID=A0A2L2BN16_9MICO|nr:DUF4143 domain-containing protein [Pontimonas salivibrio]AVG23038.1 AAA+ ATPase domain-containing protein [Pontimonas salivibrio]